MIKKLLILAALALTAAGAYRLWLAPPGEPAFQPEEGYTLLYDGRSLEGWRKIGGGATFEADGESIVGRHGPGDNTFLRTEQTFGNFSLKLQMRWDEPGNSGVQFRAQQRGGDGRTYGYQYELDPSERGGTGGIYDEARRGWLTDLENNPQARAAVRLADWNDVQIEARGPVLKTWINGVPAADIVDGLDARGFIALQVHSGDSGVMRWRRIRIRELTGMADPGESLAQEAQWRERGGLDLRAGDGALHGSASTEPRWLGSRRLFSDAMFELQVPACDEPTVIQLRHHTGATGAAESFAEVSVYADRAEARLVTPAGEQRFDLVQLNRAARHDVVGITRGGEAVLTVGARDALRVVQTGLSERGQLRILPASCAETFSITELAWYALREQHAEPQFYETLATSPAPVLSPAQALAAFRIAPGFEIELVAAEPLVGEPVAMAWDEYGRLYVVEMRGYMRDAYGTDSEAPVGRVVRLADDDGDGRMDRSEVFLDALVNPRAVAVVNAGVLIGEPPHLWLCELPARDALCERRRRVGDYATDLEAANVEHLENGLVPGLDNWLYNAKSARQVRLVRGALEEREGLFRGQWGIARDDVGRWFYNHNATWLQADFFAAEGLLAPEFENRLRGLGETLVPRSEVFSVRVNPGVNRAYLEGILREDGRLFRPTGVSGLAVYRGDQFPERFRGAVFVPESAGNVVAQFAIAEEGMALTATHQVYDDPDWGQRDFLGSTDERFRPVDAANGPDGALYIIDMYRGIIQDDYFLTDELREQIFQRELEGPLGMGRIWRVRHVDGSPSRAPVTLGQASDAELVAALSHANGWVRDTAQRLLLARQGAVRGALASLAAGAKTVPALHALWTLAGRGELSRDLVLQLAVVHDAERQAQALRAGGALLTREDLLQLAADPNAAAEPVRLQLALSLARHADDAEVRAALVALAAASAASDYVGQAVVHAVRGRELPFLRELLEGDVLADNTPARRRLLAALSENAYRGLRGDLTSDAPANPALLDLLALTAAQDGGHTWRQRALLKGLASVADSEGFTPAVLGAAPPIFTEGSVGGDSPLWTARLAARSAFTWPGDEAALGIVPLSPEQLAWVERGRAFYVQCAACHGADGQGIDSLAPALAGAEWVTGPPEWLGRIILQGMRGPVEVGGKTFRGVMPAHGHLPALDDATLAGLMTHLRRSWGNRADPVSVEAVAANRAATAGRAAPWTAQELRALPIDRGYDRFEGEYRISFVTLTVQAQADGLYLSVPMYGRGKLEQLDDTSFRARAGSEDVRIDFVLGGDGAAKELLLHRNGEKLTAPRRD